MEAITIAGQVYNVPNRYQEGHELTANEASALNQTYHENIRNNLAKRAKEGSLDQGQVDTYATDYQFGVRAAGGGGERNPVMTEAMNIARGIIKAALKRHGVKAESSAINEAAKKLIDRDEKIMELAKSRVAEQQAAASAELDALVADIPPKAAAEATAA